MPKPHGDRGSVFLSGWSAGGHLTAFLLDHPRVAAGLAISGIFELAPLRDFPHVNDKLRLSEAEIETLSPMRLPVVHKLLSIAYGTRELPAMIASSRDFFTNGVPGPRLRRLDSCGQHKPLHDSGSTSPARLSSDALDTATGGNVDRLNRLAIILLPAPAFQGGAVPRARQRETACTRKPSRSSSRSHSARSSARESAEAALARSNNLVQLILKSSGMSFGSRAKIHRQTHRQKEQSLGFPFDVEIECALRRSGRGVEHDLDRGREAIADLSQRRGTYPSKELPGLPPSQSGGAIFFAHV